MVEMIILNYTNWNICLFCIDEILEMLAILINVPKEDIHGFLDECEGYKEYFLSEYSIYSSTDLFTIALTIISSVLKTSYCNSLCMQNYVELLCEIDIDLKRMNKIESQVEKLLVNDEANLYMTEKHMSLV
jgi:hypothetical protein